MILDKLTTCKAKPQENNPDAACMYGTERPERKSSIVLEIGNKG